MKNGLFVGTVSHTRLTPLRHRFRYPAFFLVLDIDDLPELDASIAGFGYNRFAPLSIRDGDYLDGNGGFREQILRYVPDEVREQGIGRIMLVTAARYFNYVFNPVSFWYIYDRKDALVCVLAEVNNTFNEKHLYVLHQPERLSSGELTFTAQKCFHVSPFFDREGTYRFFFSPPGEHITIRIMLEKEGKKALVAVLSGKHNKLTGGRIARTLLRYPLSAALTFPRITWQAARLWIQRRLPVYRKPAPDHAMTIQPAPPTRTQRTAFRLVDRMLGQLTHGCLSVTLPDGETRIYGDDKAGADEQGTMIIHEWAFFTRLARGTDVALGDMYVDGTWSTPNLTAVLSVFARDITRINRAAEKSTLANLRNRIRHALRRNSRRGSRNNIEAHYDLSNAFFSLWLDETMTYSAALFETETEPLAEAQRRKYDRIIEKAGISADHHVLEIGCGWGGFAIHVVRKTGCRLTGITLSKEQLTLARERVAEAGLQDRITLELYDYRDMTGSFDRIVSIEMLEAVGHAYFETYFETIDRLLKPTGRAAIQAITIPDQRYEDYRRKPDWIQKRIFPGGMLPSIAVMSRAVARRTRLNILHLENLGPHYARTLNRWHDRFDAVRGKLADMGFDTKFQRMWSYYLSYCEAGFREGAVYVLQLALCKPGDPGPVSPIASES